MENLPLEIKEYLLSEDLIDLAYSDNKIRLPEVDASGTRILQNINGYALLQNEFNTKHSTIVRYIGNGSWIPMKRKVKFENIVSKDSKQAVFMDALANEDILCHVCIGPAGSGKSTIALAYAIHEYATSHRNIILTKPAVMVGAGKAFGATPGSIAEKYQPYLASYDIVLNKLGGNHSKVFFETMKEKGHLQYIPIEFTRGCTYDDCTLILDEAQNCTWSELHTLVSRMGENSKIILLGDLNQIDIKMHYTETGLHQMLSSPPFRDSSITSSIELTAQYRSPITQLVTEINKWVITQ